MRYLLEHIGCLAGSLVLAIGLSAVVTLPAQPLVRGSVQKTDSSKVTIYSKPNTNLSNIILENINICISIPNQGLKNPVVDIDSNYVPSLDWTRAGGNPDIIGERAYYTFIGSDNDSGAKSTWSSTADNPVLRLVFRKGEGYAYVQVNDLTGSGGIGTGGGPSGQSFWYVQANVLGDITDYRDKFYFSVHSRLPVNGGIAAPSNVETADLVSLPVRESPDGQYWRIFPNPTTGPLNIVSGQTRMAYLRVFDQYGRTLLLQKAEIREKEFFALDVSNLAAGMYYLEVRLPDGRIPFLDRFVLMR